MFTVEADIPRDGSLHFSDPPRRSVQLSWPNLLSNTISQPKVSTITVLLSCDPPPSLPRFRNISLKKSKAHLNDATGALETSCTLPASFWLGKYLVITRSNPPPPATARLLLRTASATVLAASYIFKVDFPPLRPPAAGGIPSVGLRRSKCAFPKHPQACVLRHSNCARMSLSGICSCPANSLRPLWPATMFVATCRTRPGPILHVQRSAA
jgi:hypothetical protein